MTKKTSLLVFLAAALCEIVFLVWMRSDYRSTLLDGGEYEVPASIHFQGAFYERNYLPVSINISEASWQGDGGVQAGQEIYLGISKDDSGHLKIDHAQPNKPFSEAYIIARADNLADGTVYFRFPADRMYMLPEQLKKLSVVELSERVRVRDEATKEIQDKMKNEVTAQIHVKDGRVAIGRVLVNGVPVEQIYTTVGKNLRVKYATSGTEKDMYDGQAALTNEEEKIN
ncbi:MAG: hypothetical protein SPI25_01830 [Dialister sp.]|nr:hypothetical protein [Dialister sp.]